MVAPHNSNYSQMMATKQRGDQFLWPERKPLFPGRMEKYFSGRKIETAMAQQIEK